MLRRVVQITKLTLVLSILGGVTYAGFSAGQNLYPKTVFADPVKTIAPVLMRIAQAESHNSHLCTDALVRSKLCPASEKGQVLVRANSNGTVDVGKYQINVFYWGAEASKHGLNLFNEKDNESFAIWLYENKGTEPWSASKKNWNK